MPSLWEACKALSQSQCECVFLFYTAQMLLENSYCGNKTIANVYAFELCLSEQFACKDLK